jgi:hypothetical protein
MKRGSPNENSGASAPGSVMVAVVARASGPAGSAGSSGSVARNVPAAAAKMEPPTPYTGTVNSGTSSTYAYSSTAPLALVMVAPALARATVEPSEP